ncbi:hypothetical protein, partial [Vibrio parahaemolyticus]|uniref:hypothetical protein n=1 Tax=Vibrio parahaemolyticus TaxID=670 RepID=UPI0021128865
KQDLTDALTEVLLEKGAAPTPQQELILMGLTIIGGKIIALMTIKAQTNSLLEQLKAMKQGGGYESAPEPEPIAPPQAAESRKAEPQS